MLPALLTDKALRLQSNCDADSHARPPSRRGTLQGRRNAVAASRVLHATSPGSSDTRRYKVAADNVYSTRSTGCLLRGARLQKRTDLTADIRHACCAAQMFLSNSEKLRCFVGHRGCIVQSGDKQFHLDEATGERGWSNSVIGEYLRLHDSPEDLFIHASSNFADDEWAGFEKGAGTDTKGAGNSFLTPSKTSATGWETTRSSEVQHCRLVTGARFSGHRGSYPGWIRTWARRRLTQSW